MMAVIGVVALVLAMRRVDSAPAVSVCVFAACAWYLAARRFAEAMARRAAEGMTTSRFQRARILARAASIAVVAIGLPDGAFLAGYYGYMEAIRATIIVNWSVDARVIYSQAKQEAIRAMIIVRNWSPDYDPLHMTMGAVIGIVCALYVASIVRRWIGPIIGDRSVVSAAAPREAIRSMPEHQPVSTRG